MSQLPDQIDPQQVQALPVVPEQPMQMMPQLGAQGIPMGQTAIPITQQNIAPGFNTTAIPNQGLSMNAADSKLHISFLTLAFLLKFYSCFAKLLRKG